MFTRNLEKDLKNGYICGGDYTINEVIDVFFYGKKLDIDGYKQLFELRYGQNLTCKEVKELMGLTDSQFENRRRWLLVALVRGALDGIEPRLRPFKTVFELKEIFLTLLKESDYKALQWFIKTDAYSGTEIKDLVSKVEYLLILIEKYNGDSKAVDLLSYEKDILMLEIVKTIGITSEEYMMAKN